MAVNFLTLLTTRQAILDQVNEAEGSQQLTPIKLNRWINNAQSRICRKTDALIGTATENVVALQPNYTLPDDWIKTRLVGYINSVGDKWTLDFFPLEHYLDIRVLTTATEPEEYVLDPSAREIYLHLTPTGTGDTFRHIYIKQPQLLSQDTDVLLDGDARLYSYHQLVIDMSVNMILAKDNAQTPSQAAELSIPEMARMKKELAPKTSGGMRMAQSFARRKSPGFLPLPSNYPRRFS